MVVNRITTMGGRAGGGARSGGGGANRIAGVGYDQYGNVINTGNTQLDSRGNALLPHNPSVHTNGYSIEYGVSLNKGTKYTVYTNFYGSGGQKFTFTSAKAGNDFLKSVKKAGYKWSGAGGVGRDKFTD